MRSSQERRSRIARTRSPAEAQQAPAQDEAPAAPPPAQAAPYAPPAPDPAEQIDHLAQLHASGAMTDDEFAAAKAKVLGT